MPDCELTDKQKDLIRSLVPGLHDGTVETTWIIFSGGGGIIGIGGLGNTGELWRSTWKGVKQADFDVFQKCGFFIRTPNGGYSLAEQTIINAVERDFTEADRPQERSNAFPRIFISYKRADRRYTERLAKVLNRIYGNDIAWFDDELFGGQQWWDEITRQIIDRDVFIYLLSREAMESVYCRTEFSVAWVHQKLIVPVVVRHGRFPDEVQKFQLILQSTSENELVVDTLAEILAAINHARGIPPAVSPEALWFKRTLEPLEENGMRVLLKVPASVEPSEGQRHLCNTGILMVPGDEISISASGKVSIDDQRTWMEPTGVYPHPDTGKPIFVHTGGAYLAVGFPQSEVGRNGVVGSLIGWIGNNINDAFFIGNEQKLSVSKNQRGFLHLAVNDTKGDYGDNFGDFSVTVDIRNV